MNAAGIKAPGAQQQAGGTVRIWGGSNVAGRRWQVAEPGLDKAPAASKADIEEAIEAMPEVAELNPEQRNRAKVFVRKVVRQVAEGTDVTFRIPGQEGAELALASGRLTHELIEVRQEFQQLTQPGPFLEHGSTTEEE